MKHIDELKTPSALQLLDGSELNRLGRANPNGRNLKTLLSKAIDHLQRNEQQNRSHNMLPRIQCWRGCLGFRTHPQASA